MHEAVHTAAIVAKLGAWAVHECYGQGCRGDALVCLKRGLLSDKLSQRQCG